MPRLDEDDSIPIERVNTTFDPQFFGLLDPGECIHIHHYSYDSTLDDAELLDRIKPEYVIMYDPDVGFVRNLEVYSINESILRLRFTKRNTRNHKCKFIL